MTYTVSGGTLNPTHSLTHSLNNVVANSLHEAASVTWNHQLVHLLWTWVLNRSDKLFCVGGVV